MEIIRREAIVVESKYASRWTEEKPHKTSGNPMPRPVFQIRGK